MDIIATGELLIDFTPIKGGALHQYVANPGGAPCNFLTMASHAGSKTAFIGKVGDDAFGRFLKEVIESNHIDTMGLVLAKDRNTTLAFVHLAENGERSFSFYRKGCADIDLRLAEVDLDHIDRAKLLHFGSLSFTDEPGRATVLAMLRYAKEKGKLISYDPNYRPSLWDNEEIARQWMEEGLAYADILKVSEEEMVLLTGQADLLQGCRELATHNIKLIFVTLGEEGVFYHTRNGHGKVAGFSSKVVDTTGAGDTFFGATVSKLLEYSDLDNIDSQTLESILLYANCAASLCIEKYGGIPSIPSDAEVQERLLQRGNQ